MEWRSLSVMSIGCVATAAPLYNSYPYRYTKKASATEPNKFSCADPNILRLRRTSEIRLDAVNIANSKTFPPTKFALDLVVAASVCVAALLIFFHDLNHFFQGDTLFWLKYRYDSASNFFHDLYRIDPGGWYRPLTNRTIESILFPWFGMAPTPYRIVGACLFSIAIAVTYFFFLYAAGKRSIAILAIVFYAFHSVNAYVTYDTAFTPELVYTIFFVLSAYSFLAYLRGQSRLSRAQSVIFFCLSLLSKEAAVTLPALLFVLAFINARSDLPFRKVITASLRSVILHLGVLVTYLTFVLGALGLGSSAFSHPFGTHDAPGYQFALDKTVFMNADTALSLAFNLPRNWYSQSNPSNGMLRQLRVFRILAILLIVVLLLTPSRRLAAVGLLWFAITLTPELPLYNHFLPHYLFLPLVGFSLTIGAAFGSAYEMVSAVKPLALVGITIIFTQLIVVNARGIWKEQTNNQLLGRSARIAQNTIDTLRALGRSSGKQTIYFINNRDPDLAWQHGWGTIFELMLPKASYNVTYSSAENSPFPHQNGSASALLILDYRHEFFTDVTEVASAGTSLSGRFFDSISSCSCAVWPKDLSLNQSYTFSARILRGKQVEVLYTLNNKPGQTFETLLDNKGEVHMTVDANAAQGIHHFLGIRSRGDTGWLYFDDRLVVR